MPQVADLRFVERPSMIRNENGQLAGYVYVDMPGRDVGSWAAGAKQLVVEKVQLPKGSNPSSGQE